MSNDEIRDALLLAEEFIANELEQRESGEGAGGFSGPEYAAYVQEAREVLAAVREALK